MLFQLLGTRFIQGVVGVLLIAATCFLQGCEDPVFAPQPAPPPSPPQACEDSQPECETWAAGGECSANQVWMHASCAKACGICESIQTPAPQLPQPTPSSTPRPTSSTPTMTPSPEPPSWMQCDLDCTYKQDTASCRDRIDWVLQHTSNQLDGAITLVNGECDQQCKCAAFDFTGAQPTPSIPPPTPSVTPPTPPTPSVTPPTTQCVQTCTYEDHTASCRSRVDWILLHTDNQLAGAIAHVNDECQGQCSCTTADFDVEVCTDPIGADSIWKMLNDHPSCQGHYKADGTGMCPGDYTSISMDLSRVSVKQGCYVWDAADCPWSAREMERLEFEAAWSDCDDIWFAPLWFTPIPWIPPQGLTGEVDLLETCRAHPGSITTSIMCAHHNPPHPDCYGNDGWGHAGKGGKGHFVAEMHDDGTLTLKKDGSLIMKYPHFLHTIRPYDAAHAHQFVDKPFRFLSDIYNGGDGDAGWHGCGTLNHNTQCKFTVKNIKMKMTPGNEFTGKCAAMNA